MKKFITLLDDKFFAKIQLWLFNKDLCEIGNRVQDFRTQWNKLR